MKTTLKSLLSATAIATIAMTGVALAETPLAEIVTTFDQRPGNPSITPDGRILMTVHPLGAPSNKMVEIDAVGGTHIYPNAAIASGDASEFKAPLSVRTDDDGVAWILDLGAHRVIGWDTNTETQTQSIVIPDDVLVPTSFLQDFALDQQRNRIIIADMTQADLTSAPTPAFVVVDLETGEARRIAENNPALMPEFEGGFALNPITIDPTYEWVYFGAMHGRTLFRVPAASFDGDATAVTDAIEEYGAKPYSDGITVDQSGNVYVNDIEEMGTGVTTSEGYTLISRLPEDQSWPDGISFGPDGYVYITTNQLDRLAALNNGVEAGSGTYDLIRVPALAAGTTGR